MCKPYNILVLFLTLFLAIPMLATAEVNWSEGVIRVKASGFAKAGGPEAYAVAEDAARTEGFAALLQTVKGVPVTVQETVDSLGQQNRVVETRVEGLVMNVMSQSKPVFSQKGDLIEATVEMTMCLHNASPACSGRESVKTVIEKILPPPAPKETDPPCTPVLDSNFAGKPLTGFGSVAIQLDGVGAYRLNLQGVPFVIKYRDAQGGLCRIMSPGTLSSEALKKLGTGGDESFRRIFQGDAAAEAQMPGQMLRISAVEISAANDIILGYEDGLYLLAIDKSQNGVFSRDGNVGLITKSAIQPSVGSTIDQILGGL